MIKKHIDYLLEFKSEKQVALEIRTHIGWYLKGIKNSNEIKNKIFKTTNINDIISLIEELRLI